MGKNLKGKELGKGLSQRKDGRYSARYVNSSGKRVESYFDSLPEARNWLDDQRYAERHQPAESQVVKNDTSVESAISSSTTVDEWTNSFFDHFCNLAQSTIHNYRGYYQKHVSPIIGTMKLSDVKPLHCSQIIKKAGDVLSRPSTQIVVSVFNCVFSSAVENNLIASNPADAIRIPKNRYENQKIKFLSIDEQKRLLYYANQSHYELLFAFLLETGLRIGEALALTFDCIDFENHTITINKSMKYWRDETSWHIGSPKTKSGNRILPLTSRAYEILAEKAKEHETRKESDAFEPLEYRDGAGKLHRVALHDLVFLNESNSKPPTNENCDANLYLVCMKAGIPRISVHCLRHTFATRAIENGMQPKVLQYLLGHSSLSTTMEIYVHNSNDAIFDAIRQFDQAAKDKWRN